MGGVRFPPPPGTIVFFHLLFLLLPDAARRRRESARVSGFHCGWALIRVSVVLVRNAVVAERSACCAVPGLSVMALSGSEPSVMERTEWVPTVPGPIETA